MNEGVRGRHGAIGVEHLAVHLLISSVGPSQKRGYRSMAAVVVAGGEERCEEIGR